MTTPGSSVGEHPPPYRARVLVRSATLNLAGQLVPAAAAVAALPLLARRYPADVLGLLSMAWALLGYFSLLDFGLGRALTTRVASRLGAGDPAAVPPLVWTTSMLLAGAGVAGGALVFVGADWIVAEGLNIPAELLSDARLATRILAVGLPFLTIASGLRGLLEARQRFDLVNLVRVPASALMYLGPAAVLPFSRHLAPAVAVLVAVRILACVGYGWCAARVEPALLRATGRPADAWRDVAGTGAWLTVANLASTSIGVLDRLVLGAILPVAAVAYYATPLEAVTKALVIPAAITAVMFPAFSAERFDESPRLGDYHRRSTRYTFLLLFPVALAVAALAPEVLSVWLGAEFAANGAAATRWLSLGVLVNGLALTPSVFLQARGAAARVAVLQAVELPLFAGVLAIATLRAGVAGAAAAWCARAAADFWCLSMLARRAAPGGRKKGRGGVGVSAAVGAAFLGVAIIEPVGVRLSLLAVVLAVAGAVAWRTSDRAEREAIAGLWRRLRGSGPPRDRRAGR